MSQSSKNVAQSSVPCAEGCPSAARETSEPGVCGGLQCFQSLLMTKALYSHSHRLTWRGDCWEHCKQFKLREKLVLILKWLFAFGKHWTCNPNLSAPLCSSGRSNRSQHRVNGCTVWDCFTLRADSQGSEMLSWLPSDFTILQRPLMCWD